MKLIVDCGATKLDAAIMDGGGVVWRGEMAGFSALNASAGDIRRAMRPISCVSFDEVHFFGAGVTDTDVARKVLDALPEAPVREAKSDIVAAARALFGDGDGLAGILGTGGNTALVRGGQIVRNIPPMGYVLGDEGSGTALGMALCRAVGRGELETEATDLFYSEFHLTYGRLIERIYRQADSRTFFASLPPFIRRYKSRYRSLDNMVHGEFCRLRSLLRAYGTSGVAVGFVGSIADAFAAELRATLSEEFTVTKILKRPMEGLIEYYANA